MEVTVLEAQHVPASPVLAVQVGTSPMRQAGLHVDRPFVVPHVGEAGAGLAVEVVLFHQLASDSLPDGSSKSSCSLPVTKQDGSIGQVKLNVRRTVPKNGATADFSPASDVAKLSNEYLDRHDLQVKVQSLIEDVLRDQPNDPFKYMLAQLRKSRDGSKGPLVPVPPSAPPPGGRKAPHANRLIVASGEQAAAVSKQDTGAVRFALDACYRAVSEKIG